MKVKTIRSVQAEWIDLFDRLRRDYAVGLPCLAAPFLSIPPMHGRSILYVGQATYGGWYRNDSPNWPLHLDSKVSICEKILERHNCTKEFVLEKAPNHPSGFWRFASKLNAIAADRWKEASKTALQHIIWTNIFKIGIQTGNPGKDLREKQADLAIETLKLEIETYKPELICFATGNVGNDVLGQAIGDPEERLWDERLNEEGLWRRRPKLGLPAIVWIGHPGRVSTACREGWLARMSEYLRD